MEPTTEETLAEAIAGLAAAVNRLAESVEGQGKTSGKVYPTMEPLAGQTLAESVKYLGDMVRPLETHTLAGAIRDLAQKMDTK